MQSKYIRVILIGTVIIICAYLFKNIYTTDQTINEKPAISKDSPNNDFLAPMDACPLPNGDIFVLYIKELSFKNISNPLIRFNRKFQVVAEYDLGLLWPHTINPTVVGTYLISDTGNKRILEIDEEGKVLNVISHFQGLGQFFINGAVGTPGNTILLTTQKSGHIIETDRKGNVIWSCHRNKTLHDATLLPSDNILVTSLNTSEVFEVDRAGRNVWVFEGSGNPKNARRLSNGNTIIAHGDGMLEITSSGETVKKNPNLKGCYNFKFLGNNRILLVHHINGLLFMNRKFKIKKAFKYFPPAGWKSLEKGLSESQVEEYRSLGYLQ